MTSRDYLNQSGDLMKLPPGQVKPGFFDLPVTEKPCLNPAHNCPIGLYIPPGRGYVHVCPGCGRSQTFVG